MKKEYMEFLKKLQHEMLTQNTVGQADPRFWVVMQEVRDYGIEDNEDGVELFDTDYCETVCDGGLKEIYEWLQELDYDFDSIIYDKFLNDILVKFKGKSSFYISDIDDLISLLRVLGYKNYTAIKYRTRYEIVQNTMFLTLRECENHIKANGYHYTKPKPYAMTAWRSPQVEMLYKILQETNWDSIK